MNLFNYSIEEIQQISNGEFLLKENPETEIRYILTDSRKLLSPEDSLFFAIRGPRHNGHDFIPDLFKKGVRNFIVSELPEDKTKYSGCNLLLVRNGLAALQELAAFHRRKFDLKVIGITGSNGKTVVKEWLFQLLREDQNIVRSPKSYNSQLGVPMSVLQIREDHSLGIFEAGISEPDEMERLEKIIKPEFGVFTNIGQAHSENFESIEQKVREKLILFKECSAMILCKDYQVINEEAKNIGIKLFTWSRKSNADLLISKVSSENGETEIQGIFRNDFIKIKIPFTDEASIENAIHCWTTMLFLGYEQEVISSRMLMLSPVAMRLELKEGINNCSIINDSYNSDLGSLSIALDFLNQQKQHEKKTLILSDILQSGKDEEFLYKEVSELLAKKGVNRLIGIGQAISRQSENFHLEKSFYESTSDFLNSYNSSFFRDETILIKGARTFGFEEISKLLQQKAHETVLEINLNAVVHNLNFYRSRLRPGVKVMAMVKAFSYGSGSFEIANTLQFHNIDYLAVAYADEGIELRKAGINVPIMVMNPEVQSYESMISYGLEPEIFSFRVLNLFSDAIKRNPRKDAQVPVHVKLDTGMHRLGFEEDDINELIVRIKNNKNIIIKSVFSHLAASDEPEHDEFTRQQISRFQKMSDTIRSHFQYPIMRHILNSGGIARFSDAQMEMVRLGIGMYGVSPNELEKIQLQHVSTLKTTISQIKNIREGESIGYSRKGKASRNMRIATVPIGYADGLNRRLGNGKGKMFINGKPAPIVGNVCMDMCMLDISEISTSEGDEVIVFGETYPITEVARDMDTIAYEVLTNVSRRVKRVYYHE